jgi:ribosomal protein S27E
VVREHFDEFERVYPERYQERYGYWRPVIRSSIDKFMKCGDLKEGFARVRCPDCKEEFFVAFSCRQRSCCPSCDQKRALLLAHRLNDEVLANVPHRQVGCTRIKKPLLFLDRPNPTLLPARSAD